MVKIGNMLTTRLNKGSERYECCDASHCRAKSERSNENGDKHSKAAENRNAVQPWILGITAVLINRPAARTSQRERIYVDVTI